MWCDKKNTPGIIFIYIVMILVVVLTIYPFIYMLAISLSGSLYVMKNEVFLYPRGLNIDMYRFVLKDPIIFTAYKNTFIYVTLGTAISLLLTSTAAYALSKDKKLIFAKQFNIMVIITMFFSGGMIPSFLVVKSFGMIDTVWGMVLPAAVSAYNLIIMKSFYTGYPSEIEDSGYIDGLNDFGVLILVRHF
jgi:putative aldouronate transport system permease protein